MEQHAEEVEHVQRADCPCGPEVVWEEGTRVIMHQPTGIGLAVRVGTCQHRTLKGGHGVNDSSQVREWGCALDVGHDGPCDYDRDLGLPQPAVAATSTAPGAAGRREAEVQEVLRAMKALDAAATEDVLLGMPLEVLRAVEAKTAAVRAMVDAFGPRREVVVFVEEIIEEVQRWV